MDRAEAERTISLREITPLLHTRNFVLRVTAHARTAAQGLGGYGCPEASVKIKRKIAHSELSAVQQGRL